MDPQAPPINPNPVPEIPPTAASTSTPPVWNDVNQKKYKTLFVLVVVLILLVLGGLGYWVYGRFYLNKQISNPASTPTTSATALATADPTATWKTFTDPDGVFSFKYPETYSIDNTHISPYLNRNITWRYNNVSVLDCRGDCPVIDTKKQTTLGGKAATIITGYVGAVGGEIPHEYISYEIKLNTKFFLFSIQAIPLYLTKDEVSVYDTPSIQKMKPQDLVIFDQILSTFKFLGEESQPGGSLNCQYKGVAYKNGDSVPSGDKCNTCSCSNGQVACTTIACE